MSVAIIVTDSCLSLLKKGLRDVRDDVTYIWAETKDQPISKFYLEDASSTNEVLEITAYLGSWHCSTSSLSLSIKQTSFSLSIHANLNQAGSWWRNCCKVAEILSWMEKRLHILNNHLSAAKPNKVIESRNTQCSNKFRI